MAKMVDARDLKSLGQSRAGSIPAERTKYRKVRITKEVAKRERFFDSAEIGDPMNPNNDKIKNGP